MSLALTSVTIEPANPDLRDTQALHRATRSAYDGLLPDGARILWAHPAPGTLLLQAPCPPTHVLPATGWALQQHTVDYAARLRQIRTGDTVRYSLIANPTRNTHPIVDGRRTGTVNHVIPPADRPAWLARRLDGALSLHTVEGRDLGSTTGRRRDARITHARHLFTGQAHVLDSARLRDLVATGVGPAKAYGCGLLLVTPMALR